ncbi:MAG: phosphatidate cytidylyltransferase [Chitinophagaceae bacterium]|nr:phosphatidate cytidylyltransferase [Chitinophagaceae bacterium]
MAFNLQTFRTRALTAVIFAAVMLFGLVWNHWSFFVLFSIIHFGCWIEYQKLVALIDPGYKELTPFHKYGVMLAGWCGMLWFTGDAYVLLGIRLHEIGWWLGLIIVFLLPITELLFTKNIRLKNIAHSFFGLLYISLSWGLMMDLRRDFFIAEMSIDHVITPAWHVVVVPCTIIASIWINDTMAYIVGSFIGRTPLSKISPKKTWEGTIGGIILAVSVTGLVAWQFDFDVKSILTIAGLSAVFGTIGDLLESKLKRLAGVKDSGTLMPGHGGFLDRFDSLLLAIPFVWFYIVLFMS